MKMAVTLALLTTLGTASAATQYGGINFHSGIPNNQVEIMKNDLRYLYQNPNTVNDQEFLAKAQLTSSSGPSLHNWLLNRIRYIVGENYEFNQSNLVAGTYTFPKTPLPVLDTPPQTGGGGGGTPDEENDVTPVKAVTIMSNFGTALYTMGKQNKFAFGVKFDGVNVWFTSARIGLLKVGEGLFSDVMAINITNVNASANSVHRLGTLFHEARHSDGNSGHTGFMHNYCPLGHPMEGVAACEKSSNGSYSIGALALKQLAQNCTSCSTTEKSMLQARVGDSFGRILAASSVAELTATLNYWNAVIARYQEIGPTSDKPEAYAKEVSGLQLRARKLQRFIETLRASNQAPVNLDPSPEGGWTPVSVQQTSAWMEASLRN